MPLGKNVAANIHELIMDNKKKGKEKGMKGKMRKMPQILSIAISVSKKKSKK